ncbi:MAG: hypothetical protein HQL47_07745, partial [Gammaproteobacteria bacterium]|nr:hypothetical protein [Gammaproteobacteria bacterium]
LMIASLQLELEQQPDTSLLTLVALTYVLAFTVVTAFTGAGFRMGFVAFSHFLMWFPATILAVRLMRRLRSKGALLISLALALAALFSLTRFIGFLLGMLGEDPLGSGPDIVMLGFVLLVSSSLANFGFFGYMLERVGMEKSRMEHERNRAIDEREQAADREDALGRMLQEQDQRFSKAARLNRLITQESLSAAMAHEINQPLSSATINQQLLRKLLQQTDPSADLLELAEDLGADIGRIAAIVSQLRSMVSNQSINLGPCVIEERVRQVIQRLDSELKRQDISLHSTLGEGETRVLGHDLL